MVSAVNCSTSLSSVAQRMCGPFNSPSEVFGEGPSTEDFESMRGSWPFEAVTVLTRGDQAHADLSEHAMVALVVQIDGAWWGVELGSTGPICIQGSTVETSGPAWIETTTTDLHVVAITGAASPMVMVTKHDRFTRNGGVRETATQISCTVDASKTPHCRELAVP
ncbi:hypothetical protein BH11MYX3_BH11MYX3_40950 [soil metagenome]